MSHPSDGHAHDLASLEAILETHRKRWATEPAARAGLDQAVAALRGQLTDFGLPPDRGVAVALLIGVDLGLGNVWDHLRFDMDGCLHADIQTIHEVGLALLDEVSR